MRQFGLWRRFLDGTRRTSSSVTPPSDETTGDGRTAGATSRSTRLATAPRHYGNSRWTTRNGQPVNGQPRPNPSLTDEEFTRLKADWVAKYGDPRRRPRPMPLPPRRRPRHPARDLAGDILAMLMMAFATVILVFGLVLLLGRAL